MEKAYYTIDAHYMGRGVAVQSPQRVLKRSIKRKAASKVDDASDSFGAYLEYNKVLRTWFVAFGIGGPVLILGERESGEESGRRRNSPLLGVNVPARCWCQVVSALINKIANWYVHAAYSGTVIRGSRKHRSAEWLMKQFWIDVVLDVTSIALFGYAAWLLLTVFSVGAAVPAPIELGTDTVVGVPT